MRFLISILLISILLCFTNTAFSTPSEGLEKSVSQLYTEKEFGLLPEVRAIPVEKDRYIVELTFNLGDRWGRDGFARYVAKNAIERLFKSNLPLAQGVVKVYCDRKEVLYLALSANHARQIRWDKESSPSHFFNTLRSHICWEKKPEDCTFFIENERIIKPSPAISIPVVLTNN